MANLLDPVLFAVLMAFGLQDWLMLKRSFAIHESRNPAIWLSLESMTATILLFYGVDLSLRVTEWQSRLVIVGLSGVLPLIAKRLANGGRSSD
jgi:hypothetical protein